MTINQRRRRRLGLTRRQPKPQFKCMECFDQDWVEMWGIDFGGPYQYDVRCYHRPRRRRRGRPARWLKRLTAMQASGPDPDIPF